MDAAPAPGEAIEHVTIGGRVLMGWMTKMLGTALDDQKRTMTESLAAINIDLQQTVQTAASRAVAPSLQQNIQLSEALHRDLSARFDDLQLRVDGVQNDVSRLFESMEARDARVDQALQVMNGALTAVVEQLSARNPEPRMAPNAIVEEPLMAEDRRSAVPDLDSVNSTADSSMNMEHTTFSADADNMNAFVQSPQDSHPSDVPALFRASDWLYPHAAQTSQFEMDKEQLPSAPMVRNESSSTMVAGPSSKDAKAPRPRTSAPKKRGRPPKAPSVAPPVMVKQEMSPSLWGGSHSKRKYSEKSGSTDRDTKKQRKSNGDEEGWPRILPPAADGSEEMIECSMCLRWYHMSCVGITAQSLAGHEDDPYACPLCQNQGTGRRLSARDKVKEGHCPRPGCDKTDKTFVIEEIIGRRKTKVEGSHQWDYLLQWEGYKETRAEWQPEFYDTLQTPTALNLINKFWETCDDEGLDLESDADVILLSRASDNGWDPNTGELSNVFSGAEVEPKH